MKDFEWADVSDLESRGLEFSSICILVVWQRQGQSWVSEVGHSYGRPRRPWLCFTQPGANASGTLLAVLTSSEQKVCKKAKNNIQAELLKNDIEIRILEP